MTKKGLSCSDWHTHPPGSEAATTPEGEACGYRWRRCHCGTSPPCECWFTGSSHIEIDIPDNGRVIIMEDPVCFASASDARDSRRLADVMLRFGTEDTTGIKIAVPNPDWDWEGPSYRIVPCEQRFVKRGPDERAPLLP
jgi:hypothetical protein